MQKQQRQHYNPGPDPDPVTELQSRRKSATERGRRVEREVCTISIFPWKLLTKAQRKRAAAHKFSSN